MDYPKTCYICGKKVLVKDNAWFHHDGEQTFTAHTACRDEQPDKWGEVLAQKKAPV